MECGSRNVQEPVKYAGIQDNLAWVNLGPYGTRTEYITRTGELRKFILQQTPKGSMVRMTALSQLDQEESRNRDNILRAQAIEAADAADRSFFVGLANIVAYTALLCGFFTGIYFLFFD